MICRFCSQWNPDGAVRCCFCHNTPGSTEDRTERAGTTTLPPQASGATFATHGSTGRANNAGPSGVEGMPVMHVVVGVAAAIALLIGLKCLF